MAFQGFSDFFRSLFGKKNDNTGVTSYRIGGGYAVSPEIQAELQTAAMYICREYIASAVQKCEIRTFLGGKEVFGKEYYRWNYAPNTYQSAAEFRSELIHKLYRDMEVLILPVGEQLIIADNFTKTDYAMMPAIFTNVSRGDLSFNRSFTTEDAIYIPLSFGDRSIDSMIGGITSTLSTTFSDAAKKYSMEGGERGTFEYDNHAFGSDEDQEAIQKLLDEDFKTYFEHKNAVVPIFAGTKYTPTKITSSQNTSVVGDMEKVLDQCIKSSAQIHKIPSPLILGNVADTKSTVENFLSFCLDPLMIKITDPASAVLYGREGVLNGSKLVADTSRVRHFDVIAEAEKMDKLIAASIMSVNEVRRKAGEPILPYKWANEFSRTKNYETIGKDDNNARNDI